LRFKPKIGCNTNTGEYTHYITYQDETKNWRTYEENGKVYAASQYERDEKLKQLRGYIDR